MLYTNFIKIPFLQLLQADHGKPILQGNVRSVPVKLSEFLRFLTAAELLRPFVVVYSNALQNHWTGKSDGKIAHPEPELNTVSGLYCGFFLSSQGRANGFFEPLMHLLLPDTLSHEEKKTAAYAAVNNKRAVKERLYTTGKHVHNINCFNPRPCEGATAGNHSHPTGKKRRYIGGEVIVERWPAKSVAFLKTS